jgi:hypothetical protein
MRIRLTCAGMPTASPTGRRDARIPARRRRPLPANRRLRAGKHAEGGHELGVIGGLAALSLDALSSVAYGPEAMMLVLVGGARARCALPCR